MSSVANNGVSMPQPIAGLTTACLKNIGFVLTDFDDTLTLEGKLPDQTLTALYRLQEAGIHVIPVTGGCAGWSDMMTRILPVSGVITEGGGVFMARNSGSVSYQYFHDEASMRVEQAAILTMVEPRLKRFESLRLTKDQAYRLTDVAIDYAQDVQPPAEQEKEMLLAELRSLGLNAKASSIHINICQKGVDKYAMANKILSEKYGLSPEQQKVNVLYVGDAPNDESMFAQFPISVGVANIAPHLPVLTHKPAYITQGKGGLGFAELTKILLDAQN